MITTQSVDAIDQTIRTAIDALPAIIAQMRDTAVDRERLLELVEHQQHQLDAMNVTVTDLRADKQMLDQRIGALLQENARLEHALVSIGNAVKQSTQVQDSIAQLASQQKNGKTAPVIEHEQSAA